MTNIFKKTIVSALVATTMLTSVTAGASSFGPEVDRINPSTLSERQEAIAIAHNQDSGFVGKYFWVRTGTNFSYFLADELAKEKNQAAVIKNAVTKTVVKEILVEKLVKDEAALAAALEVISAENFKEVQALQSSITELNDTITKLPTAKDVSIAFDNGVASVTPDPMDGSFVNGAASRDSEVAKLNADLEEQMATRADDNTYTYKYTLNGTVHTTLTTGDSETAYEQGEIFGAASVDTSSEYNRGVADGFTDGVASANSGTGFNPPLAAVATIATVELFNGRPARADSEVIATVNTEDSVGRINFSIEGNVLRVTASDAIDFGVNLVLDNLSEFGLVDGVEIIEIARAAGLASPDSWNTEQLISSIRSVIASAAEQAMTINDLELRIEMLETNSFTQNDIDRATQAGRAELQSEIDARAVAASQIRDFDAEITAYANARDVLGALTVSQADLNDPFFSELGFTQATIDAQEAMINNIGELADPGNSNAARHENSANLYFNQDAIGVINYIVDNREYSITIQLNTKTIEAMATYGDWSAIGTEFVHAFTSGYSAGYDDGYADGYSDGFVDGYGQGFTDGSNQ